MKYISYLLTAVASTLLVIVLSLSSCHSTPQATQSTTPVEQPKVSSQNSNTTVKIANFKYEPTNLTVVAGKAVQFVNQDEEPHTVTAKDGSFDSKALDTDETWTHTFTQAGTFPYFCAVHPYMKGTIVVTTKRNET